MNEKQLLKLKEEVDAAKQEVAELTGHKAALMKQLKTEFGCATVEEAEKKLKAMKKEIETLDAQIEQDSQELEEKYNG